MIQEALFMHLSAFGLPQDARAHMAPATRHAAPPCHTSFSGHCVPMHPRGPRCECATNANAQRRTSPCPSWQRGVLGTHQLVRSLSWWPWIETGVGRLTPPAEFLSPEKSLALAHEMGISLEWTQGTERSRSSENQWRSS
uniref:Uncharacterized protein n=1 Tax=Eutreptiella gymnastica TaxID=73025 RepID=A0A7S4D0E4_9EUGL